VKKVERPLRLLKLNRQSEIDSNKNGTLKLRQKMKNKKKWQGNKTAKINPTHSLPRLIKNLTQMIKKTEKKKMMMKMLKQRRNELSKRNQSEEYMIAKWHKREQIKKLVMQRITENSL